MRVSSTALLLFWQLMSLDCQYLLAQNQETIAKFTILSAKINGQDYTDYYLRRQQYIVFYSVGDGNNIYMANVCNTCTDNEQSHGKIVYITHQNTEETSEKYKTDYYKFRWQYYNSYDNRSGSAIVEFLKIYKPQGITFSMSILLENLDLLEYNGYMNGTVDFSKYR